jgi:hypothetical protein
VLFRSRYEDPDEELLPPQFKILSTKNLEKIAAIELKNKKPGEYPQTP